MRAFLAILCLAGGLAAQQQVQRMEITLERQEGTAWKKVDPGLVLDQGDRVRFLFRSNFDGYLYVMDYGTSGKYSLLFPRQETGSENRVAAGKEYRIPATEAWFRIDGPPGHDIVYWLVTPLALGGAEAGSPPLPKAKQPPKTLLPRCDDSIFRARGLCIDSSAGLRGVTESEELPENLKGVSRARSRELIIVRKEETSQVSAPAPLAGPVLYEFRLAHR